MIICTLCRPCADDTWKNNTIATSCGRVFHRTCLAEHQNKSSSCPTCKKTLTSKETSELYCCVINLNMDFGIPEDSAKRVANENIILREKIAELAQTVILLQGTVPVLCTYKQKAIDKKKEMSVNSGPFLVNLTEQLDKRFEKKKKNTLPYSSCGSRVGSLENQRTQIQGSSLDSRAKTCEMIRSKRRVYLTWRNKSYTWLSKMERASDKLLLAEACFTHHEYLDQLRLLYNKLSLEGKIIERVKQASLIYLIIGGPPDTEEETILTDMKAVENSYKEITSKIMTRLEAFTAKGNATKQQLGTRAQLQGSSGLVDKSSITPSKVQYSAGCRHERVPQCPSDLYSFRRAGMLEDDKYRTPIFV